MAVDLRALQVSVNMAHNDFMAAYHRYQAEANAEANFIIETYVRPFQEATPGRADIVRSYARKIEHEIRKFDEQVTRILSNIAFLRVEMNQTVTSAQLIVTKFTTEHFSKNTDEITGKLLRRTIDPAATAAPQDMAAKREKLNKGLETIANNVATVEKISAEIILLRLLALQTFRNENLEVSAEEAVTRITKVLKEMGLDELRDFLLELLQGYIEDLSHITAAKRFLEKFKNVNKPKAGTDVGDTDIFLNLYTILKKHDDAIERLDDTLARTRKDLRCNSYRTQCNVEGAITKNC